LAEIFVAAKLERYAGAAAIEREREREKAERPPELLALIAGQSYPHGVRRRLEYGSGVLLIRRHTRLYFSTAELMRRLAVRSAELGFKAQTDSRGSIVNHK